ncbi:MAG: NADPH-dependent F420 reductase [Calditrichia bacterium]
MKISILGAGNIGAGLGEKWAATGHDIIFGLREPGKSKYQKLKSDKIRLQTLQDSANASEIVVLAIPFPTVKENLQKLSGLKEKLIIDCTNALSGLPKDFPSAAEAIAAWSGSSKVVKAFNSTGSANLRNPRYGDMKIDTYICGDDSGAKGTVKKLAEEVGFSVVDAGDLSQAVLLEAMAKLWINLAYDQKMGPDVAFKLMHR